jgi:mono/diheme cytochrome c family protein
MRKFRIGLILGVSFFAVTAVAVTYLGLLPAAANDPSMRFEPLVAEAGLFARIERQAPKRDVSGTSAVDLVAGAGVYQKNCAVCHGLPGQPQDVVGAGMFPSAPQLMSPDGMVTDDAAGETYWKVKNGIRLSGMPSFAKVLSEDQMWQVTALVKHADKLPPKAQNALKPTALAASATSEPSAANPTH